MRTASVTETKKSLSEYLSIIKKTGEDILITERGKVIAKITPVRRGDTSEYTRIGQLELAGLIKVGNGHIPEGFWDTPAPSARASLAVEALIEEREEEF